MSQRHFAVASTFSPRFISVIQEADRIAKKFSAKLSVLHWGQRSEEKIEKFQRAFSKLNCPEADIYWCEGATPGEALVDATSSEMFDLVIAGAMDGSNELRNFTGDVARDLLLRAPCDLLLIPNPGAPPPEKETVCLLIEANSPRWSEAKLTIETIAPSSVSILAAESPLSKARAAAMGRKEDSSVFENLRKDLEKITGSVDVRTVSSNTGFTLCEIIQHNKPDFLVVESEWKDRKRILPPHLDWLQQVIPAKLFLLGKPPVE